MSLLLCIGGIACLIYGVSIFLVFSGTLFFAVWFVLGAFLLAWSHMLRVGMWDRLPAVVHVGWLTLVAISLAALVVLGSLIMRDAHNEPPEKLDYLIVLGAQVHADGPSVVLRYRLDAANDYLVENPDTICVVSGGQGPNEPFPEAKGMATYLIGRGIDASRILREPQSTTTLENITFSCRLFDQTDARIGIVTNDFHVFRAVRTARKLGLDAYGVPGGSVPWYLPNNLLRECLGVVKDLLAGNISL